MSSGLTLTDMEIMLGVLLPRAPCAQGLSALLIGPPAPADARATDGAAAPPAAAAGSIQVLRGNGSGAMGAAGGWAAAATAPEGHGAGAAAAAAAPLVPWARLEVLKEAAAQLRGLRLLQVAGLTHAQAEPLAEAMVGPFALPNLAVFSCHYI